MLIEPIFVLIATLPLIAYLLLMGLIRVSGRVLITTGGRDIAALGFAVSGLVAVGPGELFFPNRAAGVFGPWVWLALIAFYALVVTLIALTSRPKLVVYGRSPSQIFDAVYQSALQLDDTAECDRETLQVFLPRLKVHLRTSGHQGIDATYVESFEPIAATDFWDSLLGHLRENAERLPKPAPRRGGMMFVVGVVAAVSVTWYSITQRQQVVDGFFNWLLR